MDKTILGSGFLLIVAGFVGIGYGLGINVPGMLVRRATDYSFITAYVIEWVLVLLAGVALVVKGVNER